MRIAVAGGTGAVGRHVVDVVRERGHEAVVVSRSQGVDLVSGEGVLEAVRGADAVVDVASVQTRDSTASEEFFGSVTRGLLDAEQRESVGHHVALSIVGIDAAPEAYYAGKVLQERLVAEGVVPWTILRATQFHEFAQQIHGAVAVGPVRLVPRMRSQPVAAREVAERLVELVEAGPSGRVADLGGPEERRMVDMVRAYARRIGARGPVVQVPLPGAFGRAMRDGSLVAGPAADHGRQTFDEWLAALVV
jgi:uncharacterized protein YbjT (DUF2867 family)